MQQQQQERIMKRVMGLVLVTGLLAMLGGCVYPAYQRPGVVYDDGTVVGGNYDDGGYSYGYRYAPAYYSSYYDPWYYGYGGPWFGLGFYGSYYYGGHHYGHGGYHGGHGGYHGGSHGSHGSSSGGNGSHHGH